VNSIPKTENAILKINKTLSILFDSSNTILDYHERGNRNGEVVTKKRSSFFRNVLGVFNTLVLNVDGRDNPESYLHLNNSDLKSVREILIQIRTRRMATDDDLPSTHYVDRNSEDHLDIGIHGKNKKGEPKDIPLGWFFTESSLEREIFETQVKLQRFKNLKEMSAWLKENWS